MNLAILSGNVGKDPEVKHFEGGKVKAAFSLATSRKFKDKEGIRQSDWHRVIVWGPAADFVEKYVKKGTSITIEGEIQYREYTDKEGIVKPITEIVCSHIEFAGSKKDGNKSEDSKQPELEEKEDLTKIFPANEPPF